MRRTLLIAVSTIFLMISASTANAAGSGWFVGLWDGFNITAPGGPNSGLEVKMSITMQDSDTIVIRQFFTTPSGPCDGGGNGESWRAQGTAVLESGNLRSEDFVWFCGNEASPVESTFVADKKNGTIIQVIRNNLEVGLFHRISSPRIIVNR